MQAIHLTTELTPQMIKKCANTRAITDIGQLVLPTLLTEMPHWWWGFSLGQQCAVIAGSNYTIFPQKINPETAQKQLLITNIQFKGNIMASQVTELCMAMSTQVQPIHSGTFAQVQEQWDSESQVF